MATKTLRCCGCKERFDREGMIKLPAGNFHSIDCATSYARAKQSKQREKAQRVQHKADKERVKPLKQWLDQLQVLVNQYVVQVRDAGQPCRTCGTRNPNIKYDAGHWLTRAARSELRFNLYNIHKQCSVQCNVHKSGAVKEHEEYIAVAYGNHIVDWLRSNCHPSLKEQFPHYEDIKSEMARYRKLLREAGLRPNT